MMIREDLRNIRDKILRRPPITTLSASRNNALRQHRHRRHHAVAQVNLDLETQRFTIRVNTVGAAEDTVVCRLLKTPWQEVLPDMIRAAPIHGEMLACQGQRGMLIRLIRRGYLLSQSGIEVDSDVVLEFASFVFRVPYVPITVGPEDPADAAWFREDPSRVSALQDMVADAKLDKPLQLSLLKEVLHDVTQFSVLLDGNEIDLRGLYDGRQVCWIQGQQPGHHVGNAKEPETRLPSLAGIPAPRPGRLATAKETFSCVRLNELTSNIIKPKPKSLITFEQVENVEILEPEIAEHANQNHDGIVDSVEASIRPEGIPRAGTAQQDRSIAGMINRNV